MAMDIKGMQKKKRANFKLAGTILIFFAFTLLTTPFFSGVCKGEPLPGKSLDRLLEDVEKKFSRIKTVKTELTQEKNIALFSETVISKGFCIFKAPEKLRLEFTSPFKSSLVINGPKVAKYEFYNGKWRKLDSVNKEILLLVTKNISSWLKGRFKDPGTYDMRAYKDQGITIVLKPRNDEFKKFISSFELRLNKELNGLEEIVINETKKNFTKIKFHNNRVNEEIPETVFSDSGERPSEVLSW